ncbi:hypothetical protein [Methanoculleus oceani]|nr:hypothetical protein [Methanoculleus sp. CWC-02]
MVPRRDAVTAIFRSRDHTVDGNGAAPPGLPPFPRRALLTAGGIAVR